MVITFSNNKGGVLKTTLATNIASELAKKYNVCLVDFDGQSNVATTFKTNQAIKEIKYTLSDYLLEKNIKEKDILDQEINEYIQNHKIEGLNIIYSDFELSKYDLYLASGKIKNHKLQNLIEKLNSIFDFLIIDTPPNLSTLTGIALSNADIVVVPFEPDKYAIRGIKTMIEVLHENFKNKKRQIIAIPTKFNKRTRLHNEYLDVIESYFESTRNFITLSKNRISASSKSSLIVSSENVPLIFAKSKAQITERLKQEIQDFTKEILALVKK